MIYYIRKGNELLGFKYNGSTYYYIKNTQDDIIGILDNNYQEIAKYKYDSFGNTLSIKDNNGIDISNNPSHVANINPYRYRSYYYDKEIKLYYLNSRYYNPVWGRFINADGIINANGDIISGNLYAYCSNNPVMYFDTNGKFAAALPWAAPMVEGALSAIIKTIIAAGAVIIGGNILGYASTKVNSISIAKYDDTPQEQKKEHYIYRLCRGETCNKTEYVGRTKNISSTKSRHNNNPFRKGLELVEITTSPVTYAAARGLEEFYICYYQTLNKNNKTNNQIHGIAWDNIFKMDYQRAALNYLEKITYVGDFDYNRCKDFSF